MSNTPSEITLALEGEDLSEDAIRKHDLALRRMIRENVGAETLEATSPTEKGAKGDPVTIGLIVLALIKSGAAVALLNCIKAMVTREKKLKIKIKAKDGRAIEVDAVNVDSKAVREQIEELMKA